MRDPDNMPPAIEPDEVDDPELEARLDEEFPLGDGTADLEASVECPYCGESVTLALDPGSGAVQEYVEDCEVCCQPWRVSIAYHDDGHADVALRTLDA